MGKLPCRLNIITRVFLRESGSGGDVVMEAEVGVILGPQAEEPGQPPEGRETGSPLVPPPGTRPCSSS